MSSIDTPERRHYTRAREAGRLNPRSMNRNSADVLVLPMFDSFPLREIAIKNAEAARITVGPGTVRYEDDEAKPKPEAKKKKKRSWLRSGYRFIKGAITDGKLDWKDAVIALTAVLLLIGAYYAATALVGTSLVMKYVVVPAGRFLFARAKGILISLGLAKGSEQLKKIDHTLSKKPGDEEDKDKKDDSEGEDPTKKQ